MTDEAELYHCKTKTTGSYVCTQSHAVMSSHSQETLSFETAATEGGKNPKTVRRTGSVKQRNVDGMNE